MGKTPDPEKFVYTSSVVYRRQRAFIVLFAGFTVSLIVAVFVTATLQVPHNPGLALAGGIVMVTAGSVEGLSLLAMLVHQLRNALFGVDTGPFSQLIRRCEQSGLALVVISLLLAVGVVLIFCSL
jgi:hypothetical protein